MISKHIQSQLILRVVLLCLTVALTTYLCILPNYILAVVILFLCIYQIIKLIHFLNASNRKVAYFIKALINEDFTVRFDNKNNGKAFNELNLSLNQLNEKIQKVYSDNETQEKYYKELLKQAEIGVITINPQGHILFTNPKAEILLNYSPLNHIRQLDRVSGELYQLLSKSDTFNRKLIKLHNERETKQLAVKSTRIVLKNEYVQLITLQDIRSELDDKETDSWTKLIRVLTHEIMNGMAPIVSISDSLVSIYADSKTDESIEKGLEIIKKQGNDLMHFVQSYRSFLNIPKPEKKVILIDELFNRIQWLVQLEMESNNIVFNIHNQNKEATVFVDESQFLQVLINLLKNAIQATEDTETKEINLKAFIENHKTYINVSDNGKGIMEEELSQIFVPFYTTKEKGTGIGLSLSKQIIQLHEGSLEVFSVPNNKTTFTIALNP